MKFLADEILADSSQTRKSAKINSPPKFPAIRYILAFTCSHIPSAAQQTSSQLCAFCLLSVCAGYLCGSCSNGTGVTALLDRCEWCSPVQGLLVAALGERAGLPCLHCTHQSRLTVTVTLVIPSLPLSDH